MLNVIQKVRETPCGPDKHIPGQDSVCSYQLPPLVYTMRKCSPGLFLLINLTQVKANKQGQPWALYEKASQLSRDWPSTDWWGPSHGLSGWCVILQASPCCPGPGAAAWGDGSLPGLRPSWEPSPAPCRSISPVQWPCPWQWYQTKTAQNWQQAWDVVQGEKQGFGRETDQVPSQLWHLQLSGPWQSSELLWDQSAVCKRGLSYFSQSVAMRFK